MGYTKHWTLEHIKPTAESKQKLQQAMNDMTTVIERLHAIDEMIFKDVISLQTLGLWYFKITKDEQGNVTNIIFGDHLEPFIIDNEACGRNPPVEHYRNYIKTERDDYDLPVTMCLTILADAFGNDVVKGSDGDPEDWETSRMLLPMILSRKFKNPMDDGTQKLAPLKECQHYGLYRKIVSKIEQGAKKTEAVLTQKVVPALFKHDEKVEDKKPLGKRASTTPEPSLTKIQKTGEDDVEGITFPAFPSDKVLKPNPNHRSSPGFYLPASNSESLSSEDEQEAHDKESPAFRV